MFKKSVIVNMSTLLMLLLVYILCHCTEARNLQLNDLDVLPWKLEDYPELRQHQGLCITPGCKTTSHLLQQSINISVDPCDDFYEFSCGGWIASHPVPPTEAHWNQFGLVDKKLDYQLKEILLEPEDSSDPSPVNWAKKIYRTCMDTDKMEEQGIQPLAQLLDEFGGWPIASSSWNEDKFSWQSALASSTRRFGITPLLSIYVYLDRKNSNRSVLTVDQSTLVLPRAMLTDPRTYSEMLNSYAEWIMECGMEISQANKQDVSQEDMFFEAHNIVDFEIELAELTSPGEERRDAYRMYNAVSIYKLQKWSDSAVEGKSLINWFSLLKEVLRDTDIVLSDGERLIVKEMDFILKLVALLERTPSRTVANYMMWRFVQYLSRETTQNMRDLSFGFDKKYSGVKEDISRWRECVSRVNNALPFAIGYKYVQRHFDDSAKSTALSMVAHIRDSFKWRVTEALWMDENTHEAARAKADSMSEFIGFPDWLHNQSALVSYYEGLTIGENHFENVESTTRFKVRHVFQKLRKPTDRSEWVSGPAVVNAYYNPLTNSITFPAGILQAPFFSKDTIEALNYGSIGVVIGHEITHGFDDMGRQSDQLGNLAQWWSTDTVEAYVKLAKCFVEEYDSFRVPLLEAILGTDATVNGITTQGENIADNGGLRQAFHAYQRFIQEYGPEPRLPGLQQFSPEQLFFLGFSTVWCESSTTESLLQEILSDAHAPHRYRVLGSLINSPEFASTWNCPLGSPMNPERKCRIW